jgi:hydroxypyruvate reductase/glycerate 2-kinase
VLEFNGRKNLRQPLVSREAALAIWRAGVEAVQPASLLPPFVRVRDGSLLIGDQAIPLSGGGALAVVGAGKAGAGMAKALEAALGPDLLPRVKGLVNVINSAADDYRSPIRLHGARPEGDPLPTAEGVAGSRDMLELVAGLGAADTVIALLSGGASALLPLPVPGVTLAEKRDATALLSKAGASIGELNAVRKHLSLVKGGRLAEASRAGRWISLILSDVIGNPLDVIASGPSAPDPTTFADALAVIRKFKLEPRLAPSIKKHLERGAQGQEAETPKTLPGTITNLILADNSTALAAAARAAEALGYAVMIDPAPIQGVARGEGAGLIDRALKQREATGDKPLCLLAGGEPVVPRVVPGGKGGRNQEMALGAFARLGSAAFNGCFLAAGTDGEDGPTDAAGAFCDEAIMKAARSLRLDPAAYFIASRSYDFFARTNGLLKTGPTGTNVMDLVVVLIP